MHLSSAVKFLLIPQSPDSHLEADAVDGDVVEHEGLEARGRVRHQHCLSVLRNEKLVH